VTFQRKVPEAEGAVLVDVWAPWYGPCRPQAPVLDDLARHVGSGLAIVKLIADENPETVQALGVQGLPTLLLFRAGRVVARHAGFMPGPMLTQWLKTAGVHPEAV
jgi:thioredoxin 1